MTLWASLTFFLNSFFFSFYSLKLGKKGKKKLLNIIGIFVTFSYGIILSNFMVQFEDYTIRNMFFCRNLNHIKTTNMVSVLNNLKPSILSSNPNKRDTPKKRKKNPNNRVGTSNFLGNYVCKPSLPISPIVLLAKMWPSTTLLKGLCSLRSKDFVYLFVLFLEIRNINNILKLTKGVQNKRYLHHSETINDMSKILNPIHVMLQKNRTKIMIPTVF